MKFSISFLTFSLFLLLSCNNESDVSDNYQRGDGNPLPGKRALSLSSCEDWGASNLCLVTQGEGRGKTPTPTLTFSGLEETGGNIGLFDDDNCSTSIGNPSTVTDSTVQVTPPEQSTFFSEYYAQYTHTDRTTSPCLGPVDWEVNEEITITLLQATFSRATLQVSGLTVMGGSLQLFNDSNCTVFASAPLTTSSDSHSITAHPLTRYGNTTFYVQHTDSTGESGVCTGPTTYNFVSGLQNSTPIFSLDSGNHAQDDDPTPTFQLTNLEFENGTIQLFSDRNCSTTASVKKNYSYSSSGTTITANALNTIGNYNYWSKITENIESQNRCIGPVAYEYISPLQTETLTLTLSSPYTIPAFDSTPTFEVSGFNSQTGTVQLFIDATCTTSASTPTVVSSGAAQVTANTLASGNHQFYTQRTDINNRKGSCQGPINYSYQATMVSSGNSHTCALTAWGQVYCWGSGTFGQLGNDDTASKDHPVTVVSGDSLTTPLTDVIQISCGNDHTCALTSSGEVMCWGRNDSRQLGDDRSSNTDHPVTVVDGDSSTSALDGIVQISAGSDHTCALTSSGEVMCWGEGADGRLGNDCNTNCTDKDHPVTVVNGDSLSTALSSIIQISSGDEHTCALNSSGSLTCWGVGSSGQLGNDAISNKDHPVTVVDQNNSNTVLSSIIQVSSGGTHTCALTSSGNIKCWGEGANGRLGDDQSSSNKDHPVTVVDRDSSSTALSNIIQISSGGDHTCALNSSEQTVCWGRSTNGRLGDDQSSNDKDHPVTVVDGTNSGAPLSSIIQVSSGDAHTCTVNSSGEILCWGKGADGRLGNDDVVDNDRAGAVVSEDAGTAPLNINDNNGNGLLGQISVGGVHTCALTSTGGVKCWGAGSSGQLGDNSTSHRDHPVTVVATGTNNNALANIVQVSTGGYHSCAVTSSKKVKCWGKGDNGRLGNDQSSSTDHPVKVVDGDGSSTDLTNIIQISSGDSYTCALTSSGNVLCWGKGDYGQLGNDDSSDKDHPVTVVNGNNSNTPLANIVQVSSGNSHACALTFSGNVQCWGRGGNGRLGNDGVANKDHPVTVVTGDNQNTALADIVQISSGGAHTCALTSAGNVKCWGYGNYGTLGNDCNNNCTDKDHPVTVISSDGSSTPLADIIQISSGLYHVCALKSSGKSVCWGYPAYGQLGNNDTTTDKDHPVNVVTSDTNNNPLPNIVQISSGTFHSCALMSSGEVKCWGNEANGRLGNDRSDQYTTREYPVDVVDRDNSRDLLNIGLKKRPWLCQSDGSCNWLPTADSY